MNGIKKTISLPTIFLILMCGCSDDPGKTGAGLVSPTDTVQVLHYATKSTSENSYLYRINGINSTLVGKYESMEARALLQFPAISTVPDTAIIDSAVLTIRINYSYPDFPGTIAYNIHTILRTWNVTDFIWDSSTAAGFYSDIPAVTVQKVLNSGDTAMHIPILDLAKNWIKASSSDTTHGIIFLPDLSLSNIIAGLVNAIPVLKVDYRHDSDDTTHTLLIAPSRQTFVANGSIPSTGFHTFLQAGIGYRGLIRFDSLSLPRSVSITEAVLKFYPDQSMTLLNSKTRDTITAHFLRGNSYPYDTIALGAVCSPVLEDGKKVYRGNVTSMVQQWVIGTPNYGIVLRPFGEYSTFDRFAIYGAAAEDSVRPQLIITYTVFP